MNIIQKVFYLLAVGCGTLLIIMTFLAQMDSAQWYMEVLGFPRLSILAGLLLFGLSSFLLNDKQNMAYLVFVSGLVLSVGLQAWILFSYTPLAQKKVQSAETADKLVQGRVISILLANVLMSNRNSGPLLKMIDDRQPTLVLAMEVNSWWVNKLRALNKKYPYRIVFPTDNTYGMSLYSQLPLIDEKILFLNNDNVPSFHCKVMLANGKTFQLMALHPVAPKPSVRPDNMGKTENGLINAARTVAGIKMPTMVAGDFNDVGWSENTTRFDNISKLNDVRRGRGLYNTFKAGSFLLKWPLDYVYVSDEFKVVSLERLPAYGSDHYPFFAKLVLTP